MVEVNGFDITIRPAIPDDVRPIAEFQTVCWREAYRGLVPADYLDRVTVADRERRWRARLLTGEREIALAVIDAELVGVVSWADTTPPPDVPTLELKSLYVGAPCRGHGVAPALTDHALGNRPAHLWVFAENHRAQAFYTKLGFAADGGRMIDPDTGLLEHRWVRR